MKERPILFSGAMVRAILDGTKTQTRRGWKMPRGLTWYVSGSMRGEETGDICDPASNWWGHVEEIRCPYGEVGDRLYVRETWAQPTMLDPGPTFYRADYPDNVLGKYENLPPAEAITWKPSIHMPRALSRIALELTGVRAERLKDCSEEDALAEGVTLEPCHPRRAERMGRDAYQKLWDSINGAGAWEANPWVWVVEFRRVQP